MPQIVTLVSGPIVGLRAGEYLQNAANLSNDKHKLAIVQFSELLFRETKHDFYSFTTLTDYEQRALREVIYDRAKDEIAKLTSQNINVAFRLPATYEWQYVNYKFKDFGWIKEKLCPDQIITLIDAEWIMLQRMGEIAGEGSELSSFSRELLHQVKTGAMSQGKILDWLNEEVSVSEDWATFHTKDVRHVVMSRGEPPASLFRLCTRPNVPAFYLSYPMTFAKNDPKFREKKNALREQLSMRGIALDPETIELPPAPDPASGSYTVHRDLHWIVKKVTAVIGIQSDEPKFSFGMSDEFEQARGYEVEAFLIFPAGAGGPFGSGEVVPSDHMFRSTEELMRDEAFNKKFPTIEA
jgi:hypothetical protein